MRRNRTIGVGDATGSTALPRLALSHACHILSVPCFCLTFISVGGLRADSLLLGAARRVLSFLPLG